MTGISVIIPHYGDHSRTRPLIDFILHEKTTHEIEVILVDDASPDPFPPDTDVTVFRRDTNGGFGSAVNSGARVANHEWMLILNSDLEPEKGFIESLLTESSDVKQPAITGPLLVNSLGQDQHSGRRFPTISQQVFEWLSIFAPYRQRRFMLHAVGYDLGCAPNRHTSVDWLVGAALLIPTSTFLDLGGFDERYYMNCEEVDFQRRAAQRGIPRVQIGDVVVGHVGGGSSDGQATRKKWLVSARRTYARKWGGQYRLQIALTVATCANLCYNIARQLCGRKIRAGDAFREEIRLVWGPKADPRITD